MLTDERCRTGVVHFRLRVKLNTFFPRYGTRCKGLSGMGAQFSGSRQKSLHPVPRQDGGSCLSGQDLRGAAYFGRLTDPKAGFACGSMVRSFSFSRTCGAQSHMFVKKDGRFRPIGGEVHLPVEHRVRRV